MASSLECGIEMTTTCPETMGDETSESDGETEPAKSFHRRFSTNKSIKSSVCTKEGFLMKQTTSFQRWRRRYFKLKGRTLYYAKDTKSTIFDDISLTDLSVAECSTKNVNHSFQVITPFRSLVLCAESRREMEDWITALKAAASKEYYDSGDHDFLSGQHNWYASSHARPTYCNVCREALSGVTSHGLSCEVCKFKSHKRCAAKAINNCKWTTLASVGKDIIEEEDGSIAMPHQWMEGNLPVSAKCVVCDKTCGSVLRLQDWRCLWCRAMVHTACRPLYHVKCPLGPCRVSIVPPNALHSIGNDEAWEVVRPQGCSPLLVFVNSKSGDNQGVKFLRRFKQLLNPAQVFDLMNGGPGLGLRLFRHFDPFRILICSGDGSVGWVLSEIDKFHVQNQCQVGVMPLGTGNDLARVLGWGSSCDDDTHLPQLLERYEKASVKMLDRWSIMTYERTFPRKVTLPYEPIVAFEDSVVNHLTRMLQSDQHNVVISSAKVLCETVKDFITKMGSLSSELEDEGESISRKCVVLNDKLTLLLNALQEEAAASSPADEEEAAKTKSGDVKTIHEGEILKSSLDSLSEGSQATRSKRYAPRKRTEFVQRDALMSRANSLKKALRQIVEHAERVIDEQNTQTQLRSSRRVSLDRSQQLISFDPMLEAGEIESGAGQGPRNWKTTLKRYDTSSEASPCPSPVPAGASRTTNFPLLPPSPLKYQQQQAVKLQASKAKPTDITSGGNKESVMTDLNAKPVNCAKPRTSVDLDVSTLSLPVPSEFADGDLPQAEEEGNLSNREPNFTTDEEPDEVEVKPILEAVNRKLNDQVGASTPIHGEASEGRRDSYCSMVRSQGDVRDVLSISERYIEGAEEPCGSIKASPVRASRRISSGSTLRSVPRACTPPVGSAAPPAVQPAELEKEKEKEEGDKERELLRKKKKMPIINPLASLPMWPHVEGGTGGLISKALLANADALCAAVTPLMDVEGENMDMMDEKCVMNSYFGIGIDAKITLDFHLKREEHPEKCRSRARNYMWYGVLGSRECFQKTYKNLEQKVLLECDGTPIPLPSLQGVVVLNIPSFMGGTNFWGGSKEDDCFIAPSFDDRILEVVAVFGSVQMAASRIINLQHHRIAQCSSVKITILGDEGIPVQVDGEAWVQPPGVVRIVHKNRMQMLSRNRALERSLEAWQEKQMYHSSSSGKLSQAPALTDEENHVLIGFLEAVTALVRHVRLLAISQPDLDQNMYNLATQASVLLDKMHPGGKIIEGPSLRVHITDLVAVMRQLCQETHQFLRDKAQSFNLRPNQEEKLSASLSQVDVELRKCTEISGLIYFVTTDETQEKKQRSSKSGGLFKLKFRRPESKTRSQSSRSDLVEGASAVHSFAALYALPNVRHWGNDEVAAWLESLQLEEYKNNFIRHDIRGPELLTLDRRDLKEIGIHKLGHIKRLQQAIWEIKEASRSQS